MHDIRAAVRRAIESWLPWFDREAEDRALASAKAVRVNAEAEIDRDIAMTKGDAMRAGYAAYAERFRK